MGLSAVCDCGISFKMASLGKFCRRISPTTAGLILWHAVKNAPIVASPRR